jgi:hypothetical protein
MFAPLFLLKTLPDLRWCHRLAKNGVRISFIASIYPMPLASGARPEVLNARQSLMIALAACRSNTKQGGHDGALYTARMQARSHHQARRTYIGINNSFLIKSLSASPVHVVRIDACIGRQG